MERPWQVLEKKPLYQSSWIELHHWAVRLPDGSIIPDHHVLIYPYAAVGVVARDTQGNILLIDHYRFITDTRGWEVPGGKLDEGETVISAGRRELLEESGYSAETVTVLGHYYPSNGTGNQIFNIVLAEGVRCESEIPDQNEAIARRWFSAAEVRAMLKRNEIKDGLSLTALWWALS